MSTFALQHRSPRPPLHSVTEGAILPTLFCEGHALYGPRRSSIVVSFLGHTLAIMLLLAADKLVVPRHHEIRPQVVPLVTEVSPYILPPSASKAGGGGGGGDRDKLQASKGILPRFSREQLAPPAVIVRNEDNGSPSGPVCGIDRWISGGTTTIGSTVNLGFSPDRVFSEEARKAKFQGTVVLWLIVGVDGRTRDIPIQSSLGMGLDENAIDRFGGGDSTRAAKMAFPWPSRST